MLGREDIEDAFLQYCFCGAMSSDTITTNHELGSKD